MSNNEWKEGFEAGIDFVMTFINEQCGVQFDGIGAVAAELEHLRAIKKIYEEHTGVKVES